jgi:hypothetical protein
VSDLGRFAAQLRRARRSNRRPLSKSSVTLGEVNRNIDEAFHPFFRKGPLPVVADSIAHALVERDFPKSLEKFFEFNFGPLLRETLKVARRMNREGSGPKQE